MTDQSPYEHRRIRSTHELSLVVLYRILECVRLCGQCYVGGHPVALEAVRFDPHTSGLLMELVMLGRLEIEEADTSHHGVAVLASRKCFSEISEFRTDKEGLN